MSLLGTTDLSGGGAAAAPVSGLELALAATVLVGLVFLLGMYAGLGIAAADLDDELVEAELWDEPAPNSPSQVSPVQGDSAPPAAHSAGGAHLSLDPDIADGGSW